jgi:hypothetical protein
MKLCRGWVMSAGLVLAATSANAQVSNGQVLNSQVAVPDEGARPLYSAVSDVGGPYAAMPPQAPGYYGPHLLPAPEVYTVLRDNGFSPLGAPQQRGLFYTIAVLDRGGGEARLVIDARDGRIVRYARGYPDADVAVAYGPADAPVSAVRGPPRPPASVPHVASRTPAVPLPKAMPQRPDEPATAAKTPDKAPDKAASEPAKPSEPAPQSVAQAKPAAATPPATPPAVIEAKPAPQIQPTKEMPKVQGLE